MCFRCEWRAQFLEGGARLRHECGDPTTSKHACYMYQPVRPVVLRRIDNDPRPEYGGFFGCRQEAVRVADVTGMVHRTDNESFPYWVPKEG